MISHLSCFFLDEQTWCFSLLAKVFHAAGCTIPFSLLQVQKSQESVGKRRTSPVVLRSISYANSVLGTVGTPRFSVSSASILSMRNLKWGPRASHLQYESTISLCYVFWGKPMMPNSACSHQSWHWLEKNILGLRNYLLFLSSFIVRTCHLFQTGSSEMSISLSGDTCSSCDIFGNGNEFVAWIKLLSDGLGWFYVYLNNTERIYSTGFLTRSSIVSQHLNTSFLTPHDQKCLLLREASSLGETFTTFTIGLYWQHH